MIGLTILSGMIIAIIKVAIEYDWWSKKKNERNFHSLGFSIIFACCGITYYLSGYEWKIVAIFICAYWNAFEIAGNIFHKQDVFYVGQSAYFDKLLRKITKYHEILKCLIHVVTLFTLIFISLSLYNETT